MKKDNIIIIIMIIIFIICIGLVIAIIGNSNKNSNNEIYLSTEDKEERENIEPNGEKEEVEEPNGQAYKLDIKETTEEKKKYANNEERLVEYVVINDFTMIIPERLKEVGYNIELMDNNKIIEIKSKDNKYSSKIARYSDEECNVSEEQRKELERLCDEIAKEECNNKGISTEDERYKNIYNNEYSKINASNDKVLQFFNKYDLNRYTTFRGYTNEELEKAWSLLDVDINDVEEGFYESYGGILKTTYKNGETTLSQWEIGDEEYNKVLFKGMFLKTETFTGEKSELENYAVNFLVL